MKWSAPHDRVILNAVCAELGCIVIVPNTRSRCYAHSSGTVGPLTVARLRELGHAPFRA